MKRKRKYKQAIQVGHNVTEMMKLPCIQNCMKLANGSLAYGLTTRCEALSPVSYAMAGDWLVEEHDGYWRCVNENLYKERYEQHCNQADE